LFIFNMKSSYKFMQGASKSTGKSLDLQGFFACHFVFCTKKFIFTK